MPAVRAAPVLVASVPGRYGSFKTGLRAEVPLGRVENPTQERRPSDARFVRRLRMT